MALDRQTSLEEALITSVHSSTGWAFALTATFLLGISKAGIKGISILHVTLMALAFGARESTGVLVPLLVIGDVFAVWYYNKHANWSYIVKLLPWIVVGVLIGVFIGNDIDGQTFKGLMVAIILVSVALMFWWDRRQSKKIPTHWGFAGGIGVLSGITTMIGNLAGAFSNIYFLAMRLPKNEFIGTAAWLFLIINLLKMPFHILVWKTITIGTLVTNLKMLPALLIGLWVGIKLVSYIKEGFYRKMILVLTAIGAMAILLK
ncbi:MAG: sulfite exporter TauE/SafE family protein [Flavobacteriaceae bacterium]